MIFDISIWLIFLSVIFLILACDLGLFNRKDHVISFKESIINSSIYILLAIAFGFVVIPWLGDAQVTEYLHAYLVEKALSLDNIFVISLAFQAFNIPAKYQNRILFYGVLGVLAFRGIMILIGVGLVKNISWIVYIFGVFLILSGLHLLRIANKKIKFQESVIYNFIAQKFRIVSTIRNNKFFVLTDSGIHITRLFACLISIEFMDIMFAIDSIPAIFAITDNVYIIYTSNIFAVLGLRSLYFLLRNIIGKFKYLKYSLSMLLIYIGSKIFIDKFIYHIPSIVSLVITIAILLMGIILSLMHKK